MDKRIIKDLYWNNVSLIVDIMELVHCIRKQNEHSITIKLPGVMKKMGNSLDYLQSSYPELERHDLSWDLTYLITILSEMEMHQRIGDYVAVGDLLEMHVLPAFYELQGIIQEMDLSLMEEDWLENNMLALRKQNQQLADALERYGNDLESLQNDERYLAQPTSIGCFTLAIKQENAYRYLHSAHNPIWEARLFAQREYQLEEEKYLLIGWGMGYHVRELLSLYPEMDLVVVEPDLGILYYSLLLGDWREELKRVKILWDSDWSNLAEYLKEKRTIIFWKAELPFIADKGVREQLQRLAERKDSIKDFERVFYQNFRENQRSCNAYIDEIKEDIENKKVIIVAGGPSLDQNVSELACRDENTVIIAVGTVFRMLVEKNIPVDYVVFSDSYVAHQIAGLVECSIPILILSTADRQISRNYNGRKYLVCQQGYEKAKNYAEKRGFMCYDSGGSVATLALDIAIRMKAASIAFVGLDLAYYGNRAHASGTAQETYDGFEHHQVEGVNGEKLNSSQAFIRYREWMERRIRQEDATMKIVDATEGGAKKKGFEVMTLKEFLES